MKSATRLPEGCSPPALRIHAGVSRPPCLDQGPHCRPLDPASLSLFAGDTTKWTLDHGRCDIGTKLQHYSYQEIVL